MEHMVEGHMAGIGWIEMTWSEMESSWIHPTGKVVEMDSTLVLI